MSSHLRRGVVAATVIALSTASLAGCGAGRNAQTSGVNPDNAAITVGSIKIQNVNIVTSEDGDGPAAVSARIFNDGTEDETLESVKVTGAGGEVELKPAKDGDLTVPAGGSLMLGGPNNASAFLADTGDVTDGNAQPIVFELSETGAVELRATVVPARGGYSDYGPTPPAEAPSDNAPGQSEEEGAGDSASPDADGAENSGETENGAADGENAADAGSGTEESPVAE
ncbi:DUF461 domain-containing protein [Streptomyces sp. 549]|uniref:DUF461 domain-containing protein n=1 Tax=Streptomyces sp. 549 TaxID=3049076 RepID=UPI0024C2D7D1|nr:DUF461 domain-containing protein [Streptomyces sp. 549]MDK1472434.1 DUF461 domain-containing protein [Streptomyces sp. 549]